MSQNLKTVLKEAFSLKWDNASPEEIHNSMVSGAKVKGTNMCILILAILIASVGLNMNSTAVIIGAMLISPLMGGIMAFGYGIATNDLRFARNAAIGLAFQVLFCILTSTIYFTISPISTAYSELLARTNPTIWDALIAIFGGLAGIIGITRKEKTNVIPGVAIATALMPPLCTAGYGIATRQLRYFGGAMYLFFINSFFICLGTIIVIRAMKIPCKEIVDLPARRRMHHSIAIMAVLTVIPSVFFGYQIVTDTILDNNIKQYISKEFNFPDTQIVHTTIDKKKQEIRLGLIGKSLDNYVINQLARKLTDYDLENMQLKVTQTELKSGVTMEEMEEMIKDNAATNAAELDLALKNQTISELEIEKEELTQELKQLQQKELDASSLSREIMALYPEIKACSFGYQTEWEKDQIGQKEIVLMTATVEKALSERKKERITEWLNVKFNYREVRLIDQIESKRHQYQ